MKIVGRGFILAQPLLLWPFGGYTSGWEISVFLLPSLLKNIIRCHNLFTILMTGKSNSYTTTQRESTKQWGCVQKEVTQQAGICLMLPPLWNEFTSATTNPLWKSASIALSRRSWPSPQYFDIEKQAHGPLVDKPSPNHCKGLSAWVTFALPLLNYSLTSPNPHNWGDTI